MTKILNFKQLAADLSEIDALWNSIFPVLIGVIHKLGVTRRPQVAKRKSAQATKAAPVSVFLQKPTLADRLKMYRRSQHRSRSRIAKQLGIPEIDLIEIESSRIVLPEYEDKIKKLLKAA